jgi:hypothetical protein
MANLVKGPKPRTNRDKLYLFWAFNTSWFKVGWTRYDPKKRAAVLQVGCPLEIMVICTCDGGPEEESSLHRKLDQFSMMGEWFDLPEDEVWPLLQYFGAVDVAGMDMREIAYA